MGKIKILKRILNSGLESIHKMYPTDFFWFDRFFWFYTLSVSCNFESNRGEIQKILSNHKSTFLKLCQPWLMPARDNSYWVSEGLLYFSFPWRMCEKFLDYPFPFLRFLLTKKSLNSLKKTSNPLTFQYKKIAKIGAIQGRGTSHFFYLIKLVL